MNFPRVSAFGSYEMLLSRCAADAASHHHSSAVAHRSQENHNSQKNRLTVVCPYILRTQRASKQEDTAAAIAYHVPATLNELNSLQLLSVPLALVGDAAPCQQVLLGEYLGPSSYHSQLLCWRPYCYLCEHWMTYCGWHLQELCYSIRQISHNCCFAAGIC